MFREEADWIIEKLRRVDLSRVKRVLNVGSGDLRFRTQTQPHQDEIFRFLAEKGIEVYHLDQKSGEGIDIVADIGKFSPEKPYHLIFLTNVLEHLRKPKAIAKKVLSFLIPGGYLVVTVPKFYPWHPDPIDTGLRMGIHELKEFFPGTEILFSEILRIRRPQGRLGIGKFLSLFGIRWQVSCLLLKKV